MARPRARIAIVGCATVIAAGCLYVWTQPVDWESLPSLDVLQNIRKPSSPLPSSSSSPSPSSSPSLAATLECPENPEPRPVPLVTVSEDNSQYRLIHAPPPNSPDWTQVLPTLSLPAECLDAHVSTGASCGDPNGPSEQFDFVWTWSNGSESLHRKAYLAYEQSTLPVGAKSMANQAIRLKLFREHDELRHSFRSVVQHFRPHIRKIHLVTGDLPVPASDKQIARQLERSNEDLTPCQQEQQQQQQQQQQQLIPRLGQLPSWLDTSKADGDIRLDMTHHSQYFTQYNNTVFNSLAIESQLPNLPNLHDHFIYMNDDVFFSADLSPLDFYTRAFGTVFRIYPSRVIQPASERDPHGGNQAAETVSLEWASELISRRFGFRSRPYPSHESKVVSTPLVRELAAMYSEALAESGRARVRSQTGSKVTNVHTLALFMHFTVERHREAVLWSWAVARMTQIARRGDQDWVEVAWHELGGKLTGKSVDVKARPRATIGKNHTISRLGEEAGDYAFNAYRFSSDDGYPYGALGKKGQGTWPEMRKIDLGPKGHPHYKCTIERQRCFPTRDDLVAGYTPADFFQHIAFIDVECGDCIMTSLVASSGLLGLSAALPDPPSPTDPSEITFSTPPHLPLVPNFFDGDFSVEANVPRNASLRSFSVHLIHRYRYVLGRIFSGFAMLSNPKQAAEEFHRLDRRIARKEMGIVCVNDDIVQGAGEVDGLFRAWQEQHWPTRAAWEKW